MMLLVVVTSLALISMMFLLMVRVSDPLVPRAIFGVLNTVLFFPSGAVYPINALPRLDEGHRRRRSVHLRRARLQGSLVLKNTGLMAIAPDIIFLVVFTVITMAAATRLFRRTL